MKVRVENISLLEKACDLLVVNIFEGARTPGEASAAVDKALAGQISKLIKQGEISGKAETISLIHTLGKFPAERVAVVGLGKQNKFDLDGVRKASAVAIKAAKIVKAKSVATIVHGAGAGKINIADAAQATVEGAVLGGYEFEGYAADKSNFEALSSKLDELIIVEKNKAKVKKIKEGTRVGEILGRAENRARDLVNAPANKSTPVILADYARKMAKEMGLECEVLDPKKEGMEGIWEIAKGSREAAKVVVIRKQGAGSRKKRAESRKQNTGMIALIGKGVTFDAGGISLKPSKKLWEMKMDMAGAAAVIEAMRAVAELKLKKNIMAVIPLTENMPDGGALKPGDVVSSLAGITTEVISTDAEGRLVLADAVTYAKQLGATTLIDCATLTGGCITALGDVASGLLGNDEKLLKGIIKAAEKSGEKLWQLPLFEEYEEYLKSSLADQKNVSEGRGASPSIGAIFLEKFVGDTSWAHIDIAGTAYLSKGRGYLGEGATGVPLRTLVEFLKSQ